MQEAKQNSTGLAVPRRDFMKGMATVTAVGAAGGSAVAAQPASGDLTWMPAWQIREMIGRKEVSPVEVMNHFLGRIERLEPKLHAFDRLDIEGARRQALVAQQAVRDGAFLGPLHGIPIAVFDGAKVKGFRNMMWRRDQARYDSILAERLRKAGAIIVGTTASYYWDEPENKPRNPWDQTREPGNSSRGSGIAVASGMLPVAIGMDAGGSTRLPAAWSGCIGLHTTRGLVPHADYEDPTWLVPLSAGPMARDARDCALVLQAIAGRDGRDFFSFQSDVPDYSAHVDDGIKGMRLAWTDDFGWSKAVWAEESADIVARVRAAALGLSAAGAQVTPTDAVWDASAPVIMAMRSMVYGGFTPPHPPGEEEKLVARLDSVWGPAKPASPPVPSPFPPDVSPEELYRLAAESRARMVDTMEGVLKTHDVLLAPTIILEQKRLGEWGLRGHGFASAYSAHTSMMNLIGYPAASVPCGLRNGLPVGMQIIGRQGSEDVILRVAQAVSKTYPLPHPPIAV